MQPPYERNNTKYHSNYKLEIPNDRIGIKIFKFQFKNFIVSI